MKRLSWAIFLATVVSAYAQTQERKIINDAAEALGGKDRILLVKAIKVEGYGQLAYQNGGGNPTGSPDAPQKWINTNGVERWFDLEHSRMRLKQRLVQDFVFAYARNMTGISVNQVLDGDIAYNVAPDGRAVRATEAAARERRIAMLNNPVVLIRTALEPAAKLAHPRTSGNLQIVDLTTPKGDQLTLAVNSATHLPAWVSWVGPNTNLGDITFRTSWVGYTPEKGVMLPIGYNTTSDWRNVVQDKLYVDKNSVDVPVDDLAAPDAVKSVSPPNPQMNVQVIPVAKGIWFLKGTIGNSTLFEFDDHLTLFEAYANEAMAKAIIDKARTVVPSKPLTEVIISHHHFDHTGGLRTAVAEGLTIISQRGNEAIFREMTSRPAKLFPDELGKNPKPLKFKPVDDKLVLKDNSMEVVIYRVIANNHMPLGVMAYVPRDRLVAEGDLVDEGWDIVFWGNSYPDTVKYWNLQVEKDLPVHGNIHTYPEVIDFLKKQTANAQKLCDKVEAAGLSMQGCPVRQTF